MKGKNVRLIVIVLCVVLVVILRGVLLGMAPRFYYGFKGEIVVDFFFEEYGKYFIVLLEDDELQVLSFHKNTNGLWDEESVSVSTGEKAWILSVYMETEDRETDFKHIWLYAQKGTSYYEGMINEADYSLTILSYYMGNEIINVATCLADKAMGSMWLEEEVEKAINSSKQN